MLKTLHPAEDKSLHIEYGPINLGLIITRPLLISRDKLVLATDDTVLVRKKEDGSASGANITAVSTINVSFWICVYHVRQLLCCWCWSIVFWF